MFTRPIWLTLWILVITLVLSGCATAPALSRIDQRGELVLGTSGTMPPMTQTLADGKVVGFDIDLAQLMADTLEVRLRVKTLPFSELIPALQRGEVDVVISNLTITPQRNRKVPFVGPYLTSGKCIVTKQKALADVAEAEDLNTPERRIAVLKNSTSEEFARVMLPRVSLTTIENVDAGIQLVSNDRVGGLLTEYPICLTTLSRYPDAGFVSIFSLLTYEPIGIALPANDPLFVNWTENFMKRLDGTRTLEALSRRWFGELAIMAVDSGE